MPLNISIFPLVGDTHAHMLTTAGAGPQGVHSVLAASTDSPVITGPCQLVLTPDEGQRLVLQKGNAPGADPSLTGMKLVANSTRYFALGAGNWYLRWVAG